MPFPSTLALYLSPRICHTVLKLFTNILTTICFSVLDIERRAPTRLYPQPFNQTLYMIGGPRVV